uniref:Uncharacterized protein n=1 Tax=Arundo donax TaxID=35708 RepID=A0A0A9HEU5_ARUDO
MLCSAAQATGCESLHKID